MKRLHIRTLLLFSSSCLACAGRQPPPHYVQAQPVKDDAPRPVVLELPRPVPIPTPPATKRGAVPLAVAVRHGANKKRAPV